jgi:DNA recombination protein RmuC
MPYFNIIMLLLILMLNIGLIYVYLRKNRGANQQDILLGTTTELASANKDLEYLKQERDRLTLNLNAANIRVTTIENTVSLLNQEKLQLSLQLERITIENLNLKGAYNQLEVILAKLKQEINQEFTSLKNQAINELKIEASASLKLVGKSELVEPLDKNLRQLQEKIITLTEQTKAINYNSEQLNTQAQNLTMALTRDSQKKGAFGEMILSNILESVGLQSKVSYLEQEQVKYNGDVLIPDVIVKLPENRGIIIDSKNIMQAYYNNFVENNADYTNIKRAIQKTVKALAEKKYVAAVEAKLNCFVFDYIIMFIPNEGLFNFILEQENQLNGNLINEAYKQKVILAGPSTLLVLVAIIDKMWQTYEVEERAETIIRLANELADKLRITVDNLSKLGMSIKSSADSYNKVLASLDNGRADCVISKVTQLSGYPNQSKSLDNITTETRTPHTEIV